MPSRFGRPAGIDGRLIACDGILGRAIPPPIDGRAIPPPPIDGRAIPPPPIDGRAIPPPPPRAPPPPRPRWALAISAL
jgi:hypothetical protein